MPESSGADPSVAVKVRFPQTCRSHSSRGSGQFSCSASTVCPRTTPSNVIVTFITAASSQLASDRRRGIGAQSSAIASPTATALVLFGAKMMEVRLENVVMLITNAWSWSSIDGLSLSSASTSSCASVAFVDVNFISTSRLVYSKGAKGGGGEGGGGELGASSNS